ncbi:MAG: hypothetical protein FD145_538 [Candidatus Saganbacteria bacterium]|uniref:DUF1015 domain-containing protein n=1 Tax=Candidatus Saganbacteria bacterium TaxID=2575572 RepID=A0A833L1H6_UNCSA|nr:MAG: hypothetical protein FD145_538 [Candidatus Saganbacteria bacterium]
MAKIFPFKGIYYNKKKIKKPENVMSPPYDVISPEEQEELYKKSDFNFVKLILGKEFSGDTQYNNKYIRSAATFEGWLRHEIMIHDAKPGMYAYEQRFSLKGQKYTRLGFIAIMRIEDGDRGRLYPHEATLSVPKLDRIELIRASQANLDCIFTLFPDPEGKALKPFKAAMRRKPLIELKDKDKIIHKLWKVDSRPIVNKVIKEMKDKSIFIADGHHRYEAAVRYKNEMKERNTKFSEEEAYNHVMVFFTPAEGKGLVILPIHRMIKPIQNLEIGQFEDELRNYFNITIFPFSKRTEKKARKHVIKELEKSSDQHSFVMIFKDAPKFYLLKLKSEDMVDLLLEEGNTPQYKHLDVTILHAIVMNRILNITAEDQIKYTKSADEAIDSVFNGGHQVSFLLNPTKIADVLEIAGHLEKMPQKSTFFYPKLLSGLVINKMIHGEKIEY